MLVHLDAAGIFQLFCIAQGLTTAGYLLTARPRSGANRWLGLLLLAMTLQVVDYFLSRSGVYFRHRWLYFTPLFFSWSFGPLLYAHVRARPAALVAAAPLGWRHWLPGLVQVLFYAVLAAQSFDTKTWFWLSVHKPVTRYVEQYGALVSLLTYALLARRWLRPAAGAAPRGLRVWLRVLVGFCVAAALDPLLNFWYLPAGAPRFYLSSLGLPVLTYALVLVSGRRGQLTISTPTNAPDTAHAATNVRATAPPPVDVVVDPVQLAAVVRALEVEELYKDPDLTLDRLARHVGLSPNGVSQLLNAGLRQSFYDAVNGYRLAEVKRRLLTDDARRLTVLALAFEAGFNSKATFNRIFKEKTGFTPSEYRKVSQPTQ